MVDNSPFSENLLAMPWPFIQHSVGQLCTVQPEALRTCTRQRAAAWRQVLEVRRHWQHRQHPRTGAGRHERRGVTETLVMASASGQQASGYQCCCECSRCRAMLHCCGHEKAPAALTVIYSN